MVLKRKRKVHIKLEPISYEAENMHTELAYSTFLCRQGALCMVIMTLTINQNYYVRSKHECYCNTSKSKYKGTLVYKDKVYNHKNISCGQNTNRSHNDK